MPDYPIPVKNVAYVFYVGLISQADTKLLKSSPTLAAGDFKTSLDGAAFGNLATLPTVTPAAGTAVKISLSAGEMNGDNIVVTCIDAAGAEWCDQLINIQTTARGMADLAYPATSGRSMVVDAAGLVDANAVKIGPTGAGTAQTARDIGASVLLSAGSGAGQLDFTSGVVKANLAQILATALTETAGQLAAAFKKFFNIAAPAATMDHGILVDTVTTYTGNTVQTGDSYAVVNSGTFGNAAIKGYVDDIGVAGAGLTAVPWNAAWDAEVQSEVDDALVVQNLDHLLAVAAVAGDVVDNSVVARMTSKSATPAFTSFVNTTDSLEAIRDKETDIETDTAEIGAAGAGLTGVPWNAAWDAEVESEATDALNVYDGPTHAEMTAELALADDATLAAVAAVQADTDNIQTRLPAALVSGRMDSSIGAMAANVLTAAATATDFGAEVAAAVWAYVVEGSYTALQLLRLIAAALLGKVSGYAGGPGVFRDASDTKDRITATHDGNGNRTVMTLDGS